MDCTDYSLRSRLWRDLKDSHAHTIVSSPAPRLLTLLVGGESRSGHVSGKVPVTPLGLEASSCRPPKRPKEMTSHTKSHEKWMDVDSCCWPLSWRLALRSRLCPLHTTLQRKRSRPGDVRRATTSVPPSPSRSEAELPINPATPLPSTSSHALALAPNVATGAHTAETP